MQVNVALNEVCEWFCDNKTLLSVLGLDVKYILSSKSSEQDLPQEPLPDDNKEEEEEESDEKKIDLQGTIHKIISYKPKLNGPLLLGMLRPKIPTSVCIGL